MPPTTSTQLWPETETILERSRGIFLTQWEELLRLRRAVLRGSDPAVIHDLRVATRRLRVAIKLLGPISAKTPRTALKKGVRLLTRCLGELRNVDEALLFFQSRLQSGIPGENKLCRRLSRLRTKELKRMKKALIAFDYEHLDGIMGELVVKLTEDVSTARQKLSLPAYFSNTSIEHYQPVQRLLSASTSLENRESRHALRIAIKKWRYFLEIVSPVLNRDYASLLELLKAYQSILGKLNDVSTFETLLTTLKLAPDDRDNARKLLLAEDAILLKHFRELVEHKPLGYKFLI